MPTPLTTQFHLQAIMQAIADREMAVLGTGGLMDMGLSVAYASVPTKAQRALPTFEYPFTWADTVTGTFPDGQGRSTVLAGGGEDSRTYTVVRWLSLAEIDERGNDIGDMAAEMLRWPDVYRDAFLTKMQLGGAAFKAMPYRVDRADPVLGGKKHFSLGFTFEINVLAAAVFAA